MAVAIERRRKGTAKSTNTWLQITSTEGKNRQIRKVFEALGGKTWYSFCSNVVSVRLVLTCVQIGRITRGQSR